MGKTHGSSALKPGETFTLEEWRSWPEGERWELIQGLPYSMSPAPRVKHQQLVTNIIRHLAEFLDGQPCQVLVAPVDVYLDDDSLEEGQTPTVVQPDVLVVCDPDKVKDDGIHGAPDFVVEVLSDSTANKDLGVKKQMYESRGVREYWIVQPEGATVFQYLLEGERYAPLKEYRQGETVESRVLPDFRWLCPLIR